MKDNLKNEILELVKSADIVKPARYLGGEINAIIKTNADFKFIMLMLAAPPKEISNIMNEQYMDQARRSWEYKAKKRSVRVKTV